MRTRRCLWLAGSLLLACSAEDPQSEATAPAGQFPSIDAGASAGGSPSGATGGAAGGAGVGGAIPGATGGVSTPGGGGAIDAGAECQTHVVMGTQATPDMLIVLDRSGSMNPDRNDDMTDRWGGSRMALVEVTDAFDDKVRFGLMTFPGAAAQGGGRDDNENECAEGTLDVPIGLNAGPTIASTLQSMNANGRTPTAAALRAALPIISTSVTPDQTVPPRYVLLVTDGDPNCGGGGGRNGGGGDRDDAARQQTIEAIQALAAAGVKTFVVGYQTAGTDFVDQLDRMAAAGGTGEMQHRSVASGADLNMTFSEIAANVVSCSYRLATPVSDPSRVLVRVAAKPRNVNNAADGWRLESDKRTITLTGAACDEVRAGAAFAVQVTCEPVPLF